MNQSSQSRGRLGLMTLTCLVVANMVGAGVYTSSGFALADLGTRGRVMAVWLVAALFATLGAACYGGLARKITASGGEYLFLARAFHPFIGFMAGWVSLTAGFSGAIAYAALTFETYWLGGEPAQESIRWIPVALIVFFGGCHLAGMQFGSRVQNLLVAIKIVCLVALVAYGAAQIASTETVIGERQVGQVSAESGSAGTVESTDAEASGTAVSWAAFATSLMWISFSYAGYNAAIYVAGAATNATTVARSMIGATLLVGVLYLGLNAVILYAAPADALAGVPDVFRVAANYLGGANLARAVTAIVLLSLATSVSAMLQAGPHVYAQMARDGLLPRGLAVAEDALPRAAIVLQIVLAAMLTVFSNLQQMLDYLAFLLLLSSAMTVAVLLVPERWWYSHQSGRRKHSGDPTEAAGRANSGQLNAEWANSTRPMGPSNDLQEQKPDQFLAADPGATDDRTRAAHAVNQIRSQVWGWPVTPLLFVVISLLIAAMAMRFRLQTEPRGLLLALGVLPLGAVAYVVLSRREAGAAEVKLD